jgi:translation initiation factor IF-3
MPVPQKDGPRVNRDIRGVRDIQLIDDQGANRGVMPFFDALKIAEDAGLDLVEISPNSAPPVCKVLDYGRFRFAEQKKANEARKRQKVIEIKSVRRFFEEGDKVKVTLRFRGREMAHVELGAKVLQRVKTDTAEMAKVESEPSMEGRQMTMVLAPR